MNDSLKIASVVATRRFSCLVFSAMLAVTIASNCVGQVKVAAGVVKDTRRSDGFFNNLDIQLKINGEALAGAQPGRTSGKVFNWFDVGNSVLRINRSDSP